MSLLFSFMLFGFNSWASVKSRSIATTLTRLSDGLSSQQGNKSSKNISFSEDGRYIAFQSDASNLVSGDVNGLTDIFLYDSQTGTTSRLSIGLSGTEANGQSIDPQISADGAYVVFTSNASNLVAGDNNFKADVFRVTVSSGIIERISVDSNEDEADGPSGESSISGDGNLVIFSSLATNLVGSDSNDKADIFLRDISVGTTVRISISSGGIESDGNSSEPRISSDGSSVVFSSDATNLVGSDSNSCTDVFLRDLSGSTTTLLSSSSAGTLGNRSSFHPDISEDGTYVVFQSRASNLVGSDVNGYIDIFRKNTSSGVTTLVSKTNSSSQVKFDSVNPSISHDGRFITFETSSPGYVAWDSNGVSDVYIHDALSGLTIPFSTITGDIVGNKKSFESRISGDGTKLGFTSLSTNLVTPDVNNQYDLFVRHNPLADQVVTITPIANLDEDGTAQNAFTVTRYGDDSSSLTVNYTASGTATSGTDYTALTGTVTIPASSATAIIQVTPLTDIIVEPLETITITLSTDSAYTVGGLSSASVYILMDDEFEVNIEATDNVAFEDGTNRGNFRITRTGGTLGDLIVNLTTSGTAIPGVDYAALPQSIVIADGESYVDLEVIGLQDMNGEYDESVIVTLASGVGYAIGSDSNDTVTLKDDDLYEVNISATDSIIDESNVSDTGKFRIFRSIATTQSLTVNYGLKGTAQNGVDYITLSGVATILAGQSSVEVTVTAISDNDVEGYESVVVEILPGGNYTLGQSATATLVIKEDSPNPVVSISTIDNEANEAGSDSGTIRISRTGSTVGSLVVNYAIGGTAQNGVDYVTLSGTATIASSQSYVDITIAGIEDVLVEESESVVLALQSKNDYLIDDIHALAEVYITDNDMPSVQIFRDSMRTSEGKGEKAKLRIRREGDLSSSLTVNLSYSGSATVSTDYTNPGSSVVIPAGEKEKVIEITAVSDSNLESTEKAIISIGYSIDYTIGSHSLTEVSIVDNNYKVFEDILGVTPNGEINSVSVSDNGRYVLFASAASNLVMGDTNGVSDIFMADLMSETIERIVGLGGYEGNAASRSPVMSGDARYVAFSTKASNFDIDDLNNNEDIYMVDRLSGAITYVSKGYTYASQGGGSFNPYITSNGMYVAFDSNATNLVLNDTNGKRDVFLFSKVTGLLERVSINPPSAEMTVDMFMPSISDDGKIVAFHGKYYGFGNELIVIRNLEADSINTPFAAANGNSKKASVSADGAYVFYESFASNLVTNDVNASSDIFKHNINSNLLEIVSKSKEGWQGNKTSSNFSISKNGEFVSFLTSSRNLGGDFNCSTSVFVRSNLTSEILPIDNGSFNNCSSPVIESKISRTGGYIVSTLASVSGAREIIFSSNPLK